MSEGAEEAEGGGGKERTWASDCVLCVVLPYIVLVVAVFPPDVLSVVTVPLET